jgi:hypothetical protein
MCSARNAELAFPIEAAKPIRRLERGPRKIAGVIDPRVEPQAQSECRCAR